MTPLVYIASPSYSGSTLLTFLLNAHPSLSTIGELKWGAIDLATYSCSCGRLLTDCPFWSEVGRRVQAEGLPFDLNRPATDFRCRGSYLADRVARARIRSDSFERLRDVLVATLPACRARWPLVKNVNHAMVDAICNLQNGPIFVDASKDPVRLKYLLDTGLFQVRLIQLVRDARGVTNSAIKNQKMQPEPAALDWLRTHKQIEQLGRRVGSDRLLRVRYEDICTDRQQVAERIFVFLGLDPAQAKTEFDSVEHHILGNKMRLNLTGNVALDEKWRTMLTPDDLKSIDRIAGDLNRSYGYV